MFHKFKKYDSQNDKPQSFGIKNQWIAIKNSSMEEIYSVLDIIQPKPANWNAGLSACNVRFPGRLIFITPKLNNWTLILNFIAYKGENTKIYLEDISRKLNTEIAYFGNMRSVNFVMWALANKGNVERIYMHSDGKTHLDIGEKLKEEIDLELKYWNEEIDDDEEYDLLPTEETVFYIAECRSINPIKIDRNFADLSAGIIAKRSS